MKKKHIVSVITAACLTALAVSPIQGYAIAGSSYQDYSGVLSNYVLAESDSDAAFVLGSNKGVYFTAKPTEQAAEPTMFFSVNTLRCNYTEIVSADIDGVKQIYEKYQASLNFTNIEADKALVNGELTDVVRLYSVVDTPALLETASMKYPLIQKFCQEVLDSGIATSASYQYGNVNGTEFGFEGINLSDFTDDTEAVLDELLEKYYVNPGYDFNDEAIADLYRPTITLSDDADNPCPYQIKYIPFSTAANIIRAARQINPDVQYSCSMSHLLNNNSETQNDSTDTIDLLTAESPFDFGDIDSDGNVSMQDAYNTLMYSSTIHVGGDPLFTDGSDAYREASAFAAADVNLDGVVDEMDAYRILLYSSYCHLGTEPTWEDILNS